MSSDRDFNAGMYGTRNWCLGSLRHEGAGK